MVTRYRRRLAARLLRLAYRLDPSLPTVRHSGNGFIVGFGHGADLAKITPGMVSDQRPQR